MGRLSQLEYLFLNGTKLSDAGLAQLTNLKQLKRLKVQRTAVTSEGVKNLRLALPDVEIVADESLQLVTQPSQSKVKLPNGLTVELGAVSLSRIKGLENNNPGTWWHFEVLLDGLNETEPGGIWQVETIDRGRYYQDRHPSSGRWRKLDAHLPSVPKLVNVRYGLAYGDWANGFSVGPDGAAGLILGGKGSAVVSAGAEGPDGVFYDIAHDVKDREFRMVALDQGGRQHLPSKVQTDYQTGLSRTRVIFDSVELAQIKQVQVQFRKYHWVEFLNVSLDPQAEVTARVLEDYQLPTQVTGKASGGLDGRPSRIGQVKNIAVDGDLTDWADAEWTPLDVVYDGSPSDIESARFAVGWSPEGKIYVAIMVDDTEHVFTDEFKSYDAGDRAEIYLMAGGRGGPFGGCARNTMQGPAQQYTLGVKASNHREAWMCMGENLPVPADAGPEYAVRVKDSTIVYEAAITSFDYYGGLIGKPALTKLSKLELGRTVCFDVVVNSRGGGSFGMLAENSSKPKYVHTCYLARHTLVAQGGMAVTGDGGYDGTLTARGSVAAE